MKKTPSEEIDQEARLLYVLLRHATELSQRSPHLSQDSLSAAHSTRNM